MGLLNPWFLLGLAAVAVPVLVHLVQRQEHSGRKFPSLMFVRRIPFEIKRRRRIRDRALLALRCLALAAVVLAFASPYFESGAAIPNEPAVQRELVIVLDRSYSMSHSDRWSRTIAAARERIDGLRAGERAALVTFEDQARVVAEPSRDRAALRAALQSVAPGQGSTGYAAAFGAANRILVASDAARRDMVLISDLQRSALENSGALPLGEDVALEIVAVGGPPGANATVTAAALAPLREGSVEEALQVRVENTGGEALAGARFELAVNGRVTDSRPLALDAGASVELTLPLVLAADRPTRVTLTVGPDALPADDRYHLVLAPRRPITAALVEPPRPRAHHGVYFEEALKLARAPAVRIRRVSLDALDRTALADFDVLILDDVPVAPGTRREAIRDFVARGGGLIAVAGPSAGATWPGGDDGFLPGTLRTPALRAAADHLVPGAGDHPLWQAPGLDKGRVLSAARIEAHISLQPDAGDRVLARSGDGAPLLLERALGGGRALALATTADPRWSTLALEPGFVPFVHAAVAHVAGRSAWNEAYLAGEVVDLTRIAGHLPGGSEWRTHLAGGGGVLVETPAGAAERIQHPGGALYSPRQAGIYEVHRSGGGASLPFAVNVTRAESLLEAASPAEFERQVLRRARSAMLGSRRAAGATDDDPFGPARWLLLLAGLALVAESLFAMRLSRRRDARPRRART